MVAAPVSIPVNQTTMPSSYAEEVKQQSLAWNLKTLVESYENAGHTNAKWNDFARLALTEFARARANVLDTNEPSAKIISANTAAAVQAGCDDPMIRYLYIRFCMNQTNSPKAFTDAFCQSAKDMQNSTYPPVRKFNAAARALEQIVFTYGTNTAREPVWRETTPLMSQNVEAALNDKTMPAREAYVIAKEALYLVSGDTNQYERAYQCIEKPLTENWPDDYTVWLLKGSASIQTAWNARGSGYANTVSNEGLKLFYERLATAQEALQHAWILNPKDPEIAVQMMTVMLGQGGGRNRMEFWFNRAMALDPNDYEACNSKLLYIEPKWYGSVEDMLNFGRFCVQNTNWGGRIPIVLVNAHLDIAEQYIDKSEQTNYWKQPKVWEDIQSAYNRCFQINPHATDLYYYYVRFAYRAEDWSKLNELIPKLAFPINYDFFGGKDAFDKMVNLADENISNPKPTERSN